MITSSTQDSSIAQRFLRETTSEVLFDEFSRGLYSTDASIYQIKPLGVVVPKTEEDVLATLSIANDTGVSVTMRGGGTSQCGQTVGEGIIVDVSKHLNRLISVDPETRRAVVQPGIVLDQLNALLKPHRLFFPVDVSTSSRATIGGMTANNSCGARSIRYGKMVDNVRAVDAVLADGNHMHFGKWGNGTASVAPEWQQQLVSKLLDLGTREADEVARRFPKVATPSRRLQPGRTDLRGRGLHSTWHICWSARKEPSRFPMKSTSISSQSRNTRCWACVTFQPSMTLWRPPNTSSNWDRMPWSWWTRRCSNSQSEIPQFQVKLETLCEWQARIVTAGRVRRSGT